MADEWAIHGVEFANCNCNWGCPCQFGAPTTYGHCEALVAGHIESGHFNGTSLDGLDWGLLLYWPGEIAAGNGREQAFIDQSATKEQRSALRKILHGESTTPGATHFFVYNSTMTQVLDTVFTSVNVSVDVEARVADVQIADLVQGTGTPIISAFNGEPTRSGISLPNGFEYTYAEMGKGTTTSTAEIELHLTDSYGQFNYLNLSQDGVIK